MFIAYYLEQGIDHFFIYVYSVDENITKLLNSLQQKEIVTLVEWKPLPDITLRSGGIFDDSANKVHYHGQILQMNDCILKAYMR